MASAVDATELRHRGPAAQQGPEVMWEAHMPTSTSCVTAWESYSSEARPPRQKPSISNDDDIDNDANHTPTALSRSSSGDFDLDDIFDFDLDIDLGLGSTVKKGLQNRVDKLGRKIDARSAYKFKDKCMFTYAVMNVILGGFILSFPPFLLAWIYLAKSCVYYSARFVLYRSTENILFMLDFCYFVNFLLVLTLVVFPTSLIWFQTVFVLAHGPLLVAIIVWKNSLVFHSLDKVTSLFLHFMPALVLAHYRWYNPDPDPGASILATPERGYGVLPSMQDLPTQEISLVEVTLSAMLLYFLWQGLYALKVYVVGEEQMNKTFSFTYLVTQNHNKLMRKVCCGPNDSYPVWLQIVVFHGIQWMYTVLCLVPAFFLWCHKWLNYMFLVFCLAVAAWNGASWYFEVFVLKYSNVLDQQERRLKHVNELIGQGKFLDMIKNEKGKPSSKKFMALWKSVNKPATPAE